MPYNFLFHPRCSSDVLAGKHGTDARISIVLHEHSGTARGIKAFRIPSLYSPFSTNTGMPNKMTRTSEYRLPVRRALLPFQFSVVQGYLLKIRHRSE